MGKVIPAVMTLVIVVALGYWNNARYDQQQAQPPSYAETVLQGDHPLRRMVGSTQSETHASADFFLIGGITTTSTTGMTVTFAWQMNDGTYAISSLPIEKIRVKFDEQATTPHIAFKWIPTNYTVETQRLMDCCVRYGMLTIRESDWPMRINLPLDGRGDQ